MTITMRSVTPLGTLLIAGAVVFAISPATTPGAAAGLEDNLKRGSFKSCGVVTGQRGSAKVKQRNYNCDGARRLIEQKLTITGDPRGWTCRSDPNDFERLTCSKGRKRVKSKLVGAKGGLHKCEGRVYRPFAGWKNIRAVGLNCKKAKRHLEDFLDGDLHGWVQSFSGAREVFTKGDKRISGIPLGD